MKFGADLATLYYCIQYTTYYPVYMVDFPAPAEVYVSQVRELTAFEDLKPTKLLDRVSKEVDLKKVLGIQDKQLYSNEESMALTSTNYWVNMSQYLMLFLLFVPIVMAVFLFVS